MSVPAVRHLLLCLGVEFDFDEPLAPYSLRNVVFRYRPPAERPYPLAVPDVCAFVR